MSTVRVPKVIQLAEQLAEKIRASGLKQGDPYMNAAAVASELRVSASTANRVLQILAERGIVERAQKRGTIISDPNPEQPVHAIKRVYMVSFQDTVRQSGLMTDPVIVGMQRKLPGAMVQFNFLPPMGNRDHLSRLLDEARRSAEPVGLVLTKAPAHAQRMVAESGIAAVIHGYPQVGVDQMPWITVDYEEIGRLAGRFCVRSLAERLVVVLPDRPILEGDYRLFSGAQSELAAADFRADAISLRCHVSDDMDAFDWMREYVASNNGKTLFVLHPEFLTGRTPGKLSKALPPANRADIVVVDEHDHLRLGLKRALCRVHTPVSESKVGERIAELLAAQIASGDVDVSGEILPVELLNV